MSGRCRRPRPGRIQRDLHAEEALREAVVAARMLHSKRSAVTWLELLVAALELHWQLVERPVPRDEAIAHAARAAGLSDTNIDEMRADFSAAWRPDLIAIPGGKSNA